ncbi:DNA helicase-2 / ATP-dependent DNA helicase PcrA [Allopseudospirillum japonicum]|uniref:DNA 3'-5' helicase n=1 Tax=Allopseudospirillum japonicum TaxID=64971 RepID=A0A1H6S6P5_9GAMM|nr:ATP-dependent helicase [Allopseudospirillum japonicum]SEI61554.1 DNA helicase-2 / ATP-dependent DNA helicase PcrA [Allopseudospirillum japonicum]
MYKLTAEQAAVVKHTQGHARVSAVAGSGKTSTLVERVAYLLDQGVLARRLLVVMYNRSAREDFQQRLSRRLPANLAATLDVRTFHSFGWRLCHQWQRRGILASRQLQTQTWQWEKIAKQCMHVLAGQVNKSDLGDFNIEKALEDSHLQAFQSFCDHVKSGLEDASQTFTTGKYQQEYLYFIKGFDVFEKLCAQQGVMFFNDLLYRPLQALIKNPQLAKALQGFVDYIIVDEYQDVNPVQEYLLEIVAGESAQLMVVGDIDQCIYEWRGARPDYMLKHFETRFHPVTDYQLSYSFRFGPQIAFAANACIRHNQARLHNQLSIAYPESQDTKIDTKVGISQLIDMLDTWRSQANNAPEIGILVRHWSLSLTVQLVLLQMKIPFKIGRQDKFVFNLPSIQTLFSYMYLAYQDKISSLEQIPEEKRENYFYAILSAPSLYLRREQKKVLVKALAQIKDLKDLKKTSIKEVLPTASVTMQKKIQERLNILHRLLTPARLKSTARLVKHLLKVLDAHAQLEKQASQEEDALEAVRLLETFESYIKQQDAPLDVWLARWHNQEDTNQWQMHRASIEISSVHGAKGREWHTVILWGLQEGDFPCILRHQILEARELEAERRLFYVAMTRAKRHLILFIPNEKSDSSCVSRFVKEACWQQAQVLKKEDIQTKTLNQVAFLPAPWNQESRQVLQAYLDKFNQISLKEIAGNPIKKPADHAEIIPQAFCTIEQ